MPAAVYEVQCRIHGKWQEGKDHRWWFCGPTKKVWEPNASSGNANLASYPSTH